MITSDQRKQIERMAYDAVKALTGEQVKVKLDYYRNVGIIDDRVKHGKFRVQTQHIAYSSFFFVISNFSIITLMPKYRKDIVKNGFDITT